MHCELPRAIGGTANELRTAQSRPAAFLLRRLSISARRDRAGAAPCRAHICVNRRWMQAMHYLELADGGRFELSLLLLCEHPVGGAGADAIDILCDPAKMAAVLGSKAPRLPLSEAALQISPALIDLLKRMLHHDPQQRPTARQVLEHEWMTTTPAISNNEAHPCQTR